MIGDSTIAEFMRDHPSVFDDILDTPIEFANTVLDYLQNTVGKGELITGLIIGFALALFFRGTIIKLLIIGFLGVIAFWLFRN